MTWPPRWQMLTVFYRDSPRTREVSRYLNPWKYWTRAGVRREIEKRQHQDLWEGKFDREYEIVRAG